MHPGALAQGVLGPIFTLKLSSSWVLFERSLAAVRTVLVVVVTLVVVLICVVVAVVVCTLVVVWVTETTCTGSVVMLVAVDVNAGNVVVDVST